MSHHAQTPPWLKALGREEPPAEIELASGRYTIERIFKHDFFAMTALYRGESGRVVLKMGRVASIFGLPLSWIGRLHVWHESRIFEQLQHLDVVPEFTGRHGKYGLTHAFIEGQDLQKGMEVPDDFFGLLWAGLSEIHALDMAFVDLEKLENVLAGTDGRPYLFDFQISWSWPRRWGGDLWPLSWIRKRLQIADRYHYLKLHRRVRPDLMDPTDFRASSVRPFYVRLYTGMTRPLTMIRRRLLNRIDPESKRGERRRTGITHRGRTERGRVSSRSK
jgi:hypothetical protein